MNSSEFFIQEYPVISFDLFIYAKITQCKIGLFCYVAKSLNFRKMAYLKSKSLKTANFRTESIFQWSLLRLKLVFLIKNRLKLYFILPVSIEYKLFVMNCFLGKKY